MKYSNNRRKLRMNRLMIISLSIAGILFGALIFSVNIMKYAKGYFAYHVDTRSTEDTTADIPGMMQTYNSETLTEEQEELYPERPKLGDEIGELYIPKLKATLPIYEGTNDDELDKGVGHFADSVLPGEKDNCVLSGHRDTVFRKLREIGEGDTLIVRTSAGEFKYIVNKVRIVDKDDKTVIVPKPRAALTVSTCYPFQYIGAAPKRYILVAYLASKTIKE